MNASASALTREGEVQSKIRNVRMFSRTARVVCSAFYGFGLVGAVGMLIFSVVGIFFPLPDAGGTAGLSPVDRAWGIPIGGVVIGTWLAVVYQLYRLFGNMATGAIYTADNVRRLRNIGLLTLLLASLGFLIPITAHGLAAIGITIPLDSAFKFPASLQESLVNFIAAGLILLASWIMDVGLYEKDHAEELRRDADLVI